MIAVERGGILMLAEIATRHSHMGGRSQRRPSSKKAANKYKIVR